jgi:hypothetical protein
MRDLPLSTRAQAFVGQVHLLVEGLVRAAKHLDDERATAFFMGEAAKLRESIGVDPEVEYFAKVFEIELVAMTLKTRAEVKAAEMQVTDLPAWLVADAPLTRPQGRPDRRAA